MEKVKPLHGEKLLSEIYYNVENPACYSGVVPLLNAVRNYDKSVKRKDVVSFLTHQNAYTLHKPLRKRFLHNRMVPGGLDSHWQLDLCDMQRLKNENDGYAWILVCIDVLSRYVWAQPMKTKRPSEVRTAFDNIIAQGRRPLMIFTDEGTEFLGKDFQAVLKDQDIEHYTTRNPNTKAAIVERYMRTLKTRLW